MSFSESLNVPMRRKRTLSERVTDNGDPLVARKKARAAQSKKITQVRFFFSETMLLLFFWSSVATLSH